MIAAEDSRRLVALYGRWTRCGRWPGLLLTAADFGWRVASACP